MQTIDPLGATDAPVVTPPGRLPVGAGKREVDLYVRTYSTLLRSSGPIDVDTLVPAHLNIQSSLHAGADSELPDMSAFMYSTLRLPPEIVRVDRILLAQSEGVFARNGYGNINDWTLVSAPGRRRRWHWNDHDTLAVMVGSASDLDDLIPTIVAWQIEWNKLHLRIRADEELGEWITRDTASGNRPKNQSRFATSLGSARSTGSGCSWHGVRSSGRTCAGWQRVSEGCACKCLAAPSSATPVRRNAGGTRLAGQYGTLV